MAFEERFFVTMVIKVSPIHTATTVSTVKRSQAGVVQRVEHGMHALPGLEGLDLL